MQEPIREPAPETVYREDDARMRMVRPPPAGMPTPLDSPNGLVEWAPSWGGMFVTLGVLLLLGSLGVAVGIAAGGNAAAVWGAITALIAFFVGGWFCGRTLNVVNTMVASAHGLLVWAITLTFTILFALGTAMLGASTAANAARAAFAGNLLGPFGLNPIAPTAAQAAQTASASSWIAFVALLLTLICAIVGATVGNNGRLPIYTRR